MFQDILNEALTEYTEQQQKIEAICEEFSKLLQRKYNLDDQTISTVTAILLDYAKQHGGTEAIVPADVARVIRAALQKLGVDQQLTYKLVSDPLVIKNFIKDMHDASTPEPEPELKQEPAAAIQDPFAFESLETKLKIALDC